MLTINGINGIKQITPPDDWKKLAPISRVLWIHDNHRDITGGKPFDVWSVKQ